jgi:hypothetical protein
VLVLRLCDAEQYRSVQSPLTPTTYCNAVSQINSPGTAMTHVIHITRQIVECFLFTKGHRNETLEALPNEGVHNSKIFLHCRKFFSDFASCFIPVQ